MDTVNSDPTLLPSVATPSVLPPDASTQGLSAWADIDLDAIRDNVTRLGELAGGADVMAVIKGDAYGHGLVPVAHAALAGGATYLAIAQLGEALAARAAGVSAPVLTWLFPPGADLAAAIRDNVTRLGELAGGADVMAVIKGDAYGHGLVPVAHAALAGGATYLAIAQLGEALAARAAGVSAPVLTWLFPPGADLAAAIRADLTLSAGAPWALAEIAAAARAVGTTARIHLKVDTGLGRGGAWQDDLAAMFVDAARLEAEGVVDVEGIFSHFAWADAPEHPTVRAQQETFVAMIADAERAGLRPRLRHLANSAATLTNPSAHFDMVRPGVSIYGLSPVPDIGGPTHFGLREAMRVTARLINVKACGAGQGVSYGHQYTTKGATRLGLVPLGYADGVPRHAGNVGPVLVEGRRLTVAGRVCMDQFVLDLGADSTAAAGDEVVLIGREADGEPTAQDWAAAIDTINYEIVTRLGPRVPRRYLGAR